MHAADPTQQLPESRVEAGETALSGDLLVLSSSLAGDLDVAVQVIPA
jgi:hypothetical protein